MRCGHDLEAPAPRIDRVLLEALPAELTAAQRVIALTIRAFHARHGRAPRQVEWSRGASDHPSVAQVLREFDSWKAAIRAAGYEPPAQGRKPKPKPAVVVEGEHARIVA